MTDTHRPEPFFTGAAPRRVGELLREADLQARRMLADVDPATAPARVRSWAEIVEAGAQAWRAIPATGPGRSGVDGDIDTLHDVAVGVHQLIVSRGWPGPGAPDPGAEQIVAHLARVGDLVRARHRPQDPIRPDAAGDVETARTWIMHTMLAATHAVSRCLQEYEKALGSGRDRARLATPVGEVAQVRELIQRVDVVEGLARGYLDLRWPATARGERLEPVQPTRLEAAAAAWQRQAARALTFSPSAADLVLVVRTQLDASVFAFEIGGAASHEGLLTPLEGSRLQNALTTYEGSAGALLESLTLLAGRDRSFQGGLAETAAELRTAFREIIHDGTSMAGFDTVKERVDIGRTLAAVQHNLVGGVDLAWRLMAAARDPHLQVRAQGAHRIAMKSHQPKPPDGWVTAVDLVSNRLITAPTPVRYALHQQAHRTAELATEAAAASYGTKLRRAPAPQADGLTGRAHQDRQPPTLGPETPGPRIDR